MTGTQYAIASPTRRCAASGRELITGETFITALAQAPGADEFVRVDFAIDAWEAGARPAPPLAVFGFWRSVMAEPGAKKRLLVDDQSLLDLFEQTAEEIAMAQGGAQPGAAGDANDGTPAITLQDRLGFRFVLGLVLMRKRLLIHEDSVGTSMFVRVKGTPKPDPAPRPGDRSHLVEIVDPGLDEQTIVKITRQLGAALFDDATPKPAPTGA